MFGSRLESQHLPCIASLAASAVHPAWFAILTRPRHESAVAAKLQGKGVTTFLPLMREVHHWSDRRKLVQLPLFPSYVFVRLVPSPETRLPVHHTPGVLRFVGAGGLGTPIPDKEIDDVRTVLSREVACTAYPFVREGMRVRIRGGSLNGVEGIVVTKNSDRSLIVSVGLIQRSLAIRIVGYDVELI